MLFNNYQLFRSKIKSRESDGEFKQYLVQSRGSAREVQSILHIALDATYLSSEQFDDLYSQLDEIAKMLSGLINYPKK